MDLTAPTRTLMPLSQVAANALYALASDCDDDEFDRLREMSTARVVRYFYTASDCDDFALALHLVTGWPVVSLHSDEEGPLHRLVRSPEGRYLDAYGWTSLPQLARRYGVTDLLVAGADGTEYLPGLGISLTDLEDGLDEALEQALVAIRELPWAPFNTQRFRQMSSRPQPGADFPYPDERYGEAA